jgi:L-rhamnose-H+ transport protein
MPSAVLAGIGWHFVGAAFAASFYAPIEKVRKWSWEFTWVLMGVVSWILLPLSLCYVVLPNFHAFYASFDSGLLIKVALFGAMWGVGNVSYGLTMRHLGISLGVGVAIGVTLVVGTLEPPIVSGQFAALFHTHSGLWSMAGIVVALLGIAIISYAGHQKERQMGTETKEFNVVLGLALAVLCGIFSAGFSFGLHQAVPIRDAALHLGINPLFALIPCYVLIMGGGAVINMIYCFVRLAFKKDISMKADLTQPRAVIAGNSALAASAGVMWFLQFFFYSWGEAHIPQSMEYVNWMLHMSLYVLCAGFVGLALGEWKGVGSRPIRLLWGGILVIIAAANLVGLGMAS